MNDTTTSPAAAELFHRWKQFLDGGTQVTASFVAADDPAVIPDLQRLIDDYLAAHGTDGDSTQTGGTPTDGRPQAPNIPGYTVEAFLGGGGMGEVWRVRDELDRVYALKLVRPDCLSESGRERFRAEGRSMARLRHPHVVHVHHYAFHGDIPYFLMPAYPASLRDRLPDYQADPAKAVRLMAQVAAGVGHLHAHGLVHRDLKPGNILLDAAGSPVVGDFGLVKSLADGGGPSTDPAVPAAGSAETNPTGARRSKTVAGAVLGTRSYMSPEQAGGRTDLANPRWDVWALGVMLHELLTGVLPRSSAAPERLLDPAAPDNPAPAAQKPGLDPRLDRIVRRCLARDPEDRYADGAAVARDLETWLGRGRRWRTPVAAALVFLLATGGTAAVLRHRDKPPANPVAPEPEDVPAAFQAALAAGETVTVVGPTGRPTWFEVVVGREQVLPFVSDVDQTFTIDNSEVVLVDLPPTGRDRYRFEAEVSQRTTGSPGNFGLYTGRHRLPTRTGGQVECFAALWFDDADPRKPDGFRVSGARTYTRVAGAGGVLGGLEFDHGRYQPAQPPAAGWHRLIADVDPAGTTWTFDGQPAGRTPFQFAGRDLDHFRRAANVAAEIPPGFSPAGGYGFIVSGGSAAFRNVSVRPLPD